MENTKEEAPVVRPYLQVVKKMSLLLEKETWKAPYNSHGGPTTKEVCGIQTRNTQKKTQLFEGLYTMLWVTWILGKYHS